MRDSRINRSLHAEQNCEAQQDTPIDEAMTPRTNQREIPVGPAGRDEIQKSGAGRKPTEKHSRQEQPETCHTGDAFRQMMRQEMESPMRRPQRDGKMNQHHVDRMAEKTHGRRLAFRDQQHQREGHGGHDGMNYDQINRTGLAPKIVGQEDKTTQSRHN